MPEQFIIGLALLGSLWLIKRGLIPDSIPAALHRQSSAGELPRTKPHAACGGCAGCSVAHEPRPCASR